MMELAPVVIRPMMAWKAITATMILLICSIAVQAGAAVQQAALAGAVARHAGLSDLPAPDNKSETKAAALAGANYRRALQQQQSDVFHAVQWYPTVAAQAPGPLPQQQQAAPQQQQQQPQPLAAASTDGIQLLVVSFHGQQVHLKPSSSSYRPSSSVIIGCAVLSILIGLMLLCYVLHRLFPHVFHMWQNDSDSGVFSGVSDGIEVMAMGSAFTVKSCQGIPRTSLEKMPVVKYRSVCKHGRAQKLTEHCSAVASTLAVASSSSPRCRRSANMQPGSSPSSSAAAAAVPVAVAAGTVTVASDSILDSAIEHTMVIRPCLCGAAAAADSQVPSQALKSAATAAGDHHLALFRTACDAHETVTTAEELSRQSSTTSITLNTHSTFDRLGWSMLGTAISSWLSKSSSGGVAHSNKPSCGGRRSSGGQTTDNDDICAICHEEYGSNDDVKPLPCSHFYHPDCINAWLEMHDTCPLCKAQVMV